jgi:ribonuclease BN (tRNA processing enzyme)
MTLVTFWGTRGSIPTPGPETTRYGGNTSCVTITDGDALLILDAGSGIKRLAEFLGGYQRIDILLTHLHLDHIIGLGFFSPLFNPNVEIHIWSAAGNSAGLRARLNRYLSPPLFPVRIRDLPCRLHLHEVARTHFEVGHFKIYSDYVCHPSPTVGYRIQTSDKVIAYIPDHEPTLGSMNFPHNPEWTSGFSVAENADLLIHDAHFTPDEYPNHIGWGHSSTEQALQFAQMTGSKRLVFFHHDPSKTDEQLEKMMETYVDQSQWPFPVELAMESSTIEL